MITFTENAHKKNLIAEGGEGRIYAYKSNILIKIFKKIINKQKKYNKIKKLMKMKFTSSVVKPIDLVYNTNKEFIGYAMKRIQGEELNQLASRKFIRTNSITKKDILKILLHIRNTLIHLHSLNIFVGDLNDMNILFDGTDVFFIDCDSWSIDSYRCTVMNDAFKDPNLIQNYFNAKTDAFAFAIMIYKSLTRLHPFGGILQTDMNMSLQDRINKHITVIDNSDVTIPRMVDKDLFMPQKTKQDLKTIFTSDDRYIVELESFHNRLTFCTTHNDYFYAKYTKCPVCQADAYERQEFTKIGTAEGIPVRIIFEDPRVKVIFDEEIYLSMDDHICFQNYPETTPYIKGCFYGINHDGTVFYQISKEEIIIRTPKRVFQFEKKFNTMYNIIDNAIYCVSNSLMLTKIGILNDDTSYKIPLEKVSINNVFHIHSEKEYFICNSYDNTKIINISGYNYKIYDTRKIIQHVIRYDPKSYTWLFIYETIDGKFTTLIYRKKNGEIHKQEDILYTGSLNNISYYNKLLYKPKDHTIVRFNYETGEYKDFIVPIITTETKLIKQYKKFIAINEQKIYEIG